MNYLRDTEHLSGNRVQHYQQVVLEKAMEAIYGTSIWQEINNLFQKIKG